MADVVLGISAYYHDSAAALIIDGEIVAAAQEERFTRIKHDPVFPHNAIKYVLDQADIPFEKLSAIVFYEKPLLKFERLLETYHAFAPKGLVSFVVSIPIWIKEKLFIKKIMKDELLKFGRFNAPILFSEHHLSHAASAFFPSPFNEAAILTIDGVGEWATTTISRGRGNGIEILKEQHFPHSLGLLYSAFTYYTGFRVNSGEYKLMGLAPYGDIDSPQTAEFKNKILNDLVDIKEDGSILLNMDYFDFATGLKMTNNNKWEKLFGMPARRPESKIIQDYMNLALAIQQVTEKIVLRLALHAKLITGCRNIALAGGVALNCVANGRLLKSRCFDNVWIQPAAGDAGGALGAALAAWYIGMNRSRMPMQPDSMRGSYLGPEYDDKEISRLVGRYNAKAIQYNDFEALCTNVAKLIDQGNVIGWFQGRMEFGPRALGNRSIIADARNPEMQKKLNLKIKYREGFRPFAPAVLEEEVSNYFDLDNVSPYMSFVAPVESKRRNIVQSDNNQSSSLQRLYSIRSDIPAVTHIDYSARVQTVNRENNPRFYELISKFRELTKYGIVVNTSFNVRGEPIVCSPDDAYRCFLSTGMDYLVINNYLFHSTEQPPIPGLAKGGKLND